MKIVGRVTDKQDRFAFLVASGKSQRKAHQEAYPNSKKWKASSVDSQASRLFNTPKVYARYLEHKEQLDKEHKEKHLWTLEQTIDNLKWILEKSREDLSENGLRQANSTAFLNALKELNELEGLGAEREVRIELNKAKIEETYSKMQSESTESKLENYLETLNEALEND